MTDVIKSLLPPEDDPVKRWRLVVAACIVMLGLAVASGFGAFEWLGLAGFARASDLNSRVSDVTKELAGVKRDVKGIKLQLLEQSLFNAKESECNSTDPNARRFFSQRVLELQREYYEVSEGRDMPIPPCPGGRSE